MGDYAVIAGIHANLEALEAVLADIAKRGIDRVVCLGDVVVDGPDPLACLDLVLSRCQVVVRGHLEDAVLHDAPCHSMGGESTPASLRWTRRKLRPFLPWFDRRWRALRSLPARHEDGDAVFVHALDRDPFVWAQALQLASRKPSVQQALDELFATFPRFIFVAHSYARMGLLRGCKLEWPGFDAPIRLAPGEKAIVCPGAVNRLGWFGAPSAIYLSSSGDEVRWHCVEYDAAPTFAKIEALGLGDDHLWAWAGKLPRGSLSPASRELRDRLEKLGAP